MKKNNLRNEELIKMQKRKERQFEKRKEKTKEKSSLEMEEKAEGKDQV